MSQGKLLTTADVFNLMKTQLGPVSAQNNGVISIARDQYEIIELLAQSPGNFRIILAWSGETREGHKDSGIVEHELTVIVTLNRGLSAIIGQSISVSRPDGQPPLMTLNDAVRDALRAMLFPNQISSRSLEYVGTQTIEVEKYPLDAFRQTWKLKTTLATPNYVETAF